MVKYEEVVQKILSDGEKEAREDKKTIKSASKSTKRILGYSLKNQLNFVFGGCIIRFENSRIF